MPRGTRLVSSRARIQTQPTWLHTLNHFTHTTLQIFWTLIFSQHMHYIICVCVCVCVCVCAHMHAQSCPALCNPMDCGLPGFSIHGIFQARILEWVAISSSRIYSWPRDRTHVSNVSCTAGRFFSTEPSGKP